MRILKIAALAVSMAGAVAVAPASAQAVLNTSLANINGPVGSGGTGTATTTTTATGTVTRVTGPSGDSSRAYILPPTVNTWQQSAVGGGASVGITTQYSKDGNGAAYFSSPVGGAGKADMTYYFSGGGVALSSLSSMSFDFYNDPANTKTFAPVMRLLLTDKGAGAGTIALISEFQYQNQTAPTAGVWTTVSSNLNSGIFWTNSDLLGPTDAAAVGGEKTLAAWLAGNPDEDLEVIGVSIGIGSGWDASFSGAVDHVQFAFTGGPSNSFDFQVAGGGAPEPTAWALMILGLGGVGSALRRRQRTATLAA